MTQNLFENRQQSVQNDVNAANEKGARYLLEELGKKFNEQNAMLSDTESAGKRLANSVSIFLSAKLPEEMLTTFLPSKEFANCEALKCLNRWK